MSAGLPGADAVGHDWCGVADAEAAGSNGKTRFQSSFMLTTVQPSASASSNAPT